MEPLGGHTRRKWSPIRHGTSERLRLGLNEIVVAGAIWPQGERQLVCEDDDKKGLILTNTPPDSSKKVTDSDGAREDVATSFSAGKTLVGKRIKQIRQEKQLSQRELARRAGIPNATLSQIELGRSSPSISSLQRIMRAIPMSLSQFFTEVENESDVVVRQEQLVRFVQTKGVELSVLNSSLPDASMELVRGIYDPGADTGSDMLAHGSEEAGFVIRGYFELTVGTNTYELNAGDAFYFDSSQPHRYRNIGDSVGELVTVTTPPSL